MSEPPQLEGMVVVPAGAFAMGTSYAEGLGVRAADSRVQDLHLIDERPQHEVYLDAFAIDVYPVTVAKYRAYCDATDAKMPKPPKWGWVDDHPMVNVSWFDVDAYCQWAGRRLPTEAEWEKAAGGTDGRYFPWGTAWNENAIHCAYHHTGEWLGQTAPLGIHPEGVSPYGCHDMLGQVWEWCNDWADAEYYKNSPRENPKGPELGWSRILRGGSWKCNCLDDLRFTDRSWSYPDTRDDESGFRCAADVE